MLETLMKEYGLYVGGLLAALGVFYPQIEPKVKNLLASFKPSNKMAVDSGDPHQQVQWLLNYFSSQKDEQGMMLSGAIGKHLYTRLEKSGDK